MTGKEAYEAQSVFDVRYTDPRPWEALPSPEKERWEELAFETEIKDRKETA